MLFKLETNWGKYFDATSQSQRRLGEMCGVPDGESPYVSNSRRSAQLSGVKNKV